MIGVRDGNVSHRYLHTLTKKTSHKVICSRDNGWLYVKFINPLANLRFFHGVCNFEEM